MEGEGLIDAPKRTALEGIPEDKLSEEEISRKILDFWKNLATKHGGEVEASWIEAFVVIHPDSKMIEAESKRDIILTNQEFGIPHVQFPMRALYYSKLTNKPALQHTESDEIIEMRPVMGALKRVVGY